ncbi:MAG: hypothetical protein C6I00_02025 [Nitratiruptor sp.]|nr:hypothetical protein [Nitratiruptor sp.]NPA84067.1 thiamine phosphate synthase [Campylobacterota bacterium]
MATANLLYKITDPALYGRNPTRFFKGLKSSKRADIVALRDKRNPKLRSLVARFAAYPHDALPCLSGNFPLARRFALPCFHAPGNQLQVAKRARRAGWLTIYSAHTLQELRKAKGARIHLITYSPIFPTPNKGAPLGLKALRRASYVSKNLLALGGILHERQIRQAHRHGARGAAAIRYFFPRRS